MLQDFDKAGSATARTVMSPPPQPSHLSPQVIVDEDSDSGEGHGKNMNDDGKAIASLDFPSVIVPSPVATRHPGGDAAAEVPSPVRHFLEAPPLAAVAIDDAAQRQHAAPSTLIPGDSLASPEHATGFPSVDVLSASPATSLAASVAAIPLPLSSPQPIAASSKTLGRSDEITGNTVETNDRVATSSRWSLSAAQWMMPAALQQRQAPFALDAPSPAVAVPPLSLDIATAARPPGQQATQPPVQENVMMVTLPEASDEGNEEEGDSDERTGPPPVVRVSLVEPTGLPDLSSKKFQKVLQSDGMPGLLAAPAMPAYMTRHFPVTKG